MYRFNTVLLAVVFVVLILTVPLVTFATDYHVTQNGSGARDGKSEGNAWSISNFNSSTNWSTTENANRIDPGDVVYFYGTITTGVVVAGNGADGNRITLV